MTMVTTGTELQVARNSIVLNQIEACTYYGEKKEGRAYIVLKFHDLCLPSKKISESAQRAGETA